MDSLENSQNNYIEDEFLKIFQPILIVQSFLGFVRISVTNGIISGTTILQRLYLLGILCIGNYSAYYTILLDSPFGDKTNELSLHYLSLCFYFITLLKYFISSIIHCFTYRNSNVQLYLTLQNIDRSLNLNSNSGQYNYIYRRNLSLISLLLFSYCVWAIWYCICFINDSHVWILLTFMLFASHDVELINFISIIHFLYTRMEYIDNKITNRGNVKWRNLIRNIEDENSNRDLLQGVINITKSHCLVRKIYSLHVSVNCEMQTDLLEYL